MNNPEELFPPTPGGMVDTKRKQMAADAGQLQTLNEAEEALFQPKFSVPARLPAAELARARTFSVSTANNNPIVELLGQDNNRRNAVITTLDAPVVISFSQVAAEDPRNAVNETGLSANGFVLPVNFPLLVDSKSVIYCTALSLSLTTPSLPATTVYAQNQNAFGAKVVITGGTVTTIDVNGLNVGSGDGTYYVPAYGAIAVTYSSTPPTWAWSYPFTATRVCVAAYVYSEE